MTDKENGTEAERLLESAREIAAALNRAEAQGFHVIVDEDGDGGVTVWSEDREDFAEAMRRKGDGVLEARYE